MRVAGGGTTVDPAVHLDRWFLFGEKKRDRFLLLYHYLRRLNQLGDVVKRNFPSALLT